MCEQCVKDLKKKECPACRKQNFTVKPSVLARRMIGSMPQVCPNECGTTSTIGNMSDHLKKCLNRVLQCAKCAFEGKKADFLAHLTKDHEQILLESFDKHIKKDEEEKKATLQNPAQHLGSQMAQMNLEFDRIGRAVNDAGRQARLGQSGKYYCSGRLEGKCICCDGQCGPTNGCNCNSCMKLDLKSRMLPKGYLVNKEGRAVRKG